MVSPWQNLFKSMKIIYNHTPINCPSLATAPRRGCGYKVRNCSDSILGTELYSPHHLSPSQEDAAELRVKFSSYLNNNLERTHLFNKPISMWATGLQLVIISLHPYRLPCSRETGSPRGLGRHQTLLTTSLGAVLAPLQPTRLRSFISFLPSSIQMVFTGLI